VAARRGVRLAAWVAAAIVAIAGVAWLVLRVPDIPVATLRAKYASPASQFVEVMPGLTVHLRDEGKRDGVPLVLLHGSNASLHTWEPWVARLGGRYRIISFDFPAHGLTGPAPDGQYTAVAYAKVLDAVAANRGLTRFVLAGNSMGGGVAARYAVDHPGRLIGLILVDAGGKPPTGKRDLPLAFRIADTPILRDIVADFTPRWLIANGVRGSVSVQSVMTEPVIDRYWELLRYPGNRAATLARFRQGYGSVSPAELARVDTPTLILWGREDRFIPVASAAYFAHALPHSRTIIYDGVGHLPMEETPDRSATDVAAFVDAIAKSPADRTGPDTPPSPPLPPVKG
jgi:pimeloyl-ACP methyl ester carboxylesterase